MTNRWPASDSWGCSPQNRMSKCSANVATARKPSAPFTNAIPTWCCSTSRCRRMNGFQVIDTIGPDQMPMVIFVTAYDQHAIRAFQVRALDYLLKPFDRERFTDALQRARTHLESQTRRRPRSPADGADEGHEARSAKDRSPGRQVGRAAVLPESGRDRLDRGGRQLRPPARRQPGAPAARDDERHRGAAGFGDASSASTAHASSTSNASRRCSPG